MWAKGQSVKAYIQLHQSANSAKQTLNHSFLLLMLSDICTAKTNPQLISIYHRFSV